MLYFTVFVTIPNTLRNNRNQTSLFKPKMQRVCLFWGPKMCGNRCTFVCYITLDGIAFSSTMCFKTWLGNGKKNAHKICSRWTPNPCIEHGVCQFDGSEDKARQSMQSWDWCVLRSQCDTLPWIIQPCLQAATGRTHQYSRICSVVFQRRTRSAMASTINLAALQWPSNS